MTKVELLTLKLAATTDTYIPVALELFERALAEGVVEIMGQTKDGRVLYRVVG